MGSIANVIKSFFKEQAKSAEELARVCATGKCKLTDQEIARQVLEFGVTGESFDAMVDTIHRRIAAQKTLDQAEKAHTSSVGRVASIRDQFRAAARAVQEQEKEFEALKEKLEEDHRRKHGELVKAENALRDQLKAADEARKFLHVTPPGPFLEDQRKQLIARRAQLVQHREKVERATNSNKETLSERREAFEGAVNRAQREEYGRRVRVAEAEVGKNEQQLAKLGVEFDALNSAIEAVKAARLECLTQIEAEERMAAIRSGLDKTLLAPLPPKPAEAVAVG